MSEIINSPLLLTLAGAIVILVHVPLLWIRRYNLTPFYISLFLILDPLSSIRADITLLKWARTYCAFLIAFSAFLSSERPKFGLASTSTLVFAVYFALSGMWSDYPGEALLLKFSTFFLTLVAGIAAGNICISGGKFRATIHWLVIIGGIAALLLFPGAIESVVRGYRFNPLMINPIRIGVSCYAIFAVSLTGAIGDTKQGFKIFAGITTCLFAFIVFATGSRGPAAAVVIITATLMLMGFRWNALRAIATVTIALALIGIWILFLDSDQFTYLERSGFTGREKIWGESLWKMDNKSLILGMGWVYSGGFVGGLGNTNLHNAYLQVLIESGIVGCTLFGIAIITTLVRAMQAIQRATRTHGYSPRLAVSMAAGIILASLGHAVSESGLMFGSSASTLLFGFALGIIDRTYFSLKKERLQQLPLIYPFRRLAIQNPVSILILSKDPHIR